MLFKQGDVAAKLEKNLNYTKLFPIFIKMIIFLLQNETLPFIK